MDKNKIIGSVILEGATTAEDSVIIGANKSGNRLRATGTLQDMDVKNRNERIYSKADLSPEINGPRMTELINAGQFYGECGHPLTEDLVRQQTIDPKLKCVLFEKVWIEGNLIKANFLGANNTYGADFDADLRDGRKPAFSLRALGYIENDQGKAYVKGIKVVTWDHVIYPSHKVAYTANVLTESAMGKNNNNEFVVPVNDPGTIITITDHDVATAINKMQRESANLTQIVESFNTLYDKITLIDENTLALTSRFGEKILVNLEQHVSNILMDYAFKM